MRILSLTPSSPYPPIGGYVRIYHLLTRLARDHDVGLVSFYRHERERAALLEFGEQGIEVWPVPAARRDWRRVLTAASAYLRPQPRGVTLWDQPAMHQAIAQLHAQAAWDVVQAEFSYLAPYLLRLRGPVRMLVALDVYSITLSRRARVAPTPWVRWAIGLESRKFARYEAWIGDQVDRVIAVSQHDGDALRALNPRTSVCVVPNGVDVTGLQPGAPRPEGWELLFLGTPTHYPNLDGACWLLKAIWPQIKARVPQARLTLVNLDVPSVRKAARGAVDVTLLGRVPDVVSYYQAADLLLVPLRVGSGTRFKILEAMALGVPVVSTAIGCEGLEAVPGEHLLVADDPADFARQVARLLADLPQRQRLAAVARRFVEERYSWERIAAQLEAVYEEVVKERRELP